MLHGSIFLQLRLQGYTFMGSSYSRSLTGFLLSHLDWTLLGYRLGFYSPEGFPGWPLGNLLSHVSIAYLLVLSSK